MAVKLMFNTIIIVQESFKKKFFYNCVNVEILILFLFYFDVKKLYFYMLLEKAI